MRNEWEKFTAWVTQYALSDGIFKAQAEKSPAVGADMIIVEGASGLTEYYHREGRDWHRTEAAAIERAEAMRIAKIASLEMQIAKLRKLRFAPQELNGISEVPK